MASEKAQEAANVVGEQVKKTGELVTGAQKTAEEAAGTGELLHTSKSLRVSGEDRVLL